MESPLGSVAEAVNENGVCFGMLKFPGPVTVGGVLPWRSGRTTIAAAALAVGDDRLEAVNVESIDAVGRQVLGTANSGIGHDGNAAARLIGMRSGSVTTSAVTRCAVKGVICSPLMSHLMRDIVDGKGSPRGLGKPVTPQPLPPEP